MTIKLQTDFYHLIGKSDGILQVFDLIERAADSDSSVILTGESGTVKEIAIELSLSVPTIST